MVGSAGLPIEMYEVSQASPDITKSGQEPE